MNTIFLCAILGFLSFFFVVIPITGGVVLNPVLALFFTPQAAISLSVFFFMLNSGIKATLFREYIIWKEVYTMLPLALVGSVVGSLAIGLIAEFYLLIVMLAMTLYFFYKKILSLKGYAKKTKSSNLGSVLAGLMSGFMQGVGLGGGGSTRKAYFLSENFSLQQMNGTTSILSVAIGLVATITRLADKQVSIESLLPILYAIPVILLGNHYGKIVLSRINKRTTNVIIIFTFLFTIIALLYQLFNF